MTGFEDAGATGDRSLLIRLGGLAGLVAIIVHMIVNMVLKTFPDESLTQSELQQYFQDEAVTWAIVHGMRYLAIVGLAFMVTGLYVRVRGRRSEGVDGWRTLGFIGSLLWLANLMITNGIEMFLFLDFGLMDNRAELFWMVFGLTRVLFSAEMIAWVLVAFGFSVAGVRTKALPGWLGYSGIGVSALGFVASIGVVHVLRGGWLSSVADLAALGIILWFLCASGYLLLRGDGDLPSPAASS